MKKILIALSVLISVNSFSQDSVQVTLTVQYRDIEYWSSFMYNDNNYESLYDTVKLKLRGPNVPTGVSTTTVTAYTIDWVLLFTKLSSDELALNALCTKRLKDLLLLVGQQYLTDKVNANDTSKTDGFQAMRQFGKSRARRQPQ